MSRQLKKEIWPYRTTLPMVLNIAERSEWLDENIGQWSIDWYGIHTHDSIYFFKKEENLTMFLLRWASK